MSKFAYVTENQKTGKRESAPSMAAARLSAKAKSLDTGNPIAIIAIRDGTEYPQGAYYGRSWQGGAHHVIRKGKEPK